MLYTHEVLLQKLRQKEEELRDLRIIAAFSDLLIDKMKSKELLFSEHDLDVLIKSLRLRVNGIDSLVLSADMFNFTLNYLNYSDQLKESVSLFLRTLKFLLELNNPLSNEVVITFEHNTNPSAGKVVGKASCTLSFRVKLETYKLLVSFSLDTNTYRSNIYDPSVFPLLFDTQYLKISPRKSSYRYIIPNDKIGLFQETHKDLLYRIDYTNFCKWVEPIINLCEREIDNAKE